MATPITDCLVRRILQCHVARSDRMHLCPQHLHAFHVWALALHISSTHIHRAWHIHQCASSSSSHAMLSSTRFGNDTSLSHLLRYENLSQRIVDFVSTRVVQVFSFQIELTAILLTHSLGKIEWGRATHIIPKQRVEFLFEFLAFDDRQISLLQVLHGFIQNLRHVSTSIVPIETVLIHRKMIHVLGLLLALLQSVSVICEILLFHHI